MTQITVAVVAVSFIIGLQTLTKYVLIMFWNVLPYLSSKFDLHCVFKYVLPCQLCLVESWQSTGWKSLFKVNLHTPFNTWYQTKRLELLLPKWFMTCCNRPLVSVLLYFFFFLKSSYVLASVLISSFFC